MRFLFFMLFFVSSLSASETPYFVTKLFESFCDSKVVHLYGDGAFCRQTSNSIIYEYEKPWFWYSKPSLDGSIRCQFVCKKWRYYDSRKGWSSWKFREGRKNFAFVSAVAVKQFGKLVLVSKNFPDSSKPLTVFDARSLPRL